MKRILVTSFLLTALLLVVAPLAAGAQSGGWKCGYGGSLRPRAAASRTRPPVRQHLYCRARRHVFFHQPTVWHHHAGAGCRKRDQSVAYLCGPTSDHSGLRCVPAGAVFRWKLPTEPLLRR